MSNIELNRFNKAAVGRELRMIELKKEVNQLCGLAGQIRRYPLDFEKENGYAEDQDQTASKMPDWDPRPR